MGEKIYYNWSRGEKQMDCLSISISLIIPIAIICYICNILNIHTSDLVIPGIYALFIIAIIFAILNFIYPPKK